MIFNRYKENMKLKTVFCPDPEGSDGFQYKILRKNDEYMLTPRQFVDFLALLKSGNASDENGNAVNPAQLEAILDEITEVKDPWRAEHLDAKFDSSGLIRKTFRITYHKIKSDGTIEEVTEPLEDCLMSDKEPGIDLDDWLKNANNQGLPKPDAKKGDLWYWYPRNGAVARFRANSDRANLNCNRNPTNTNDALGVRPAKLYKK